MPTSTPCVKPTPTTMQPGDRGADQRHQVEQADQQRQHEGERHAEQLQRDQVHDERDHRDGEIRADVARDDAVDVVDPRLDQLGRLVRQQRQAAAGDPGQLDRREQRQEEHGDGADQEAEHRAGEPEQRGRRRPAHASARR